MNSAGTHFESLLNRALALDPDAARGLRELSGRVLLLELTGGAGDKGADVPYRLYVLPHADGVCIAREYDGTPDVAISGTTALFMRQLFRGPTVSGELTIRGDIELGQRFQRIMSAFRPDWEEGLARAIGDIPAHQLGRMVRGLGDWAVRAGRTLGIDTAEYLKEESMVLAKRDRVDKFLQAVDQLRADIDRLDKRVQRLGGR